ncbi:hypothetical protein U1Q18_048554 [Sarracenia purpurea var. burkii]
MQIRRRPPLRESLGSISGDKGERVGADSGATGGAGGRSHRRIGRRCGGWSDSAMAIFLRLVLVLISGVGGLIRERE